MPDRNPKGVHLVGTIPLGDAENVLRTSAAVLGARLRRAPDGETGARLNWTKWQFDVMAALTEFEVLPHGADTFPTVRRQPGIAVTDIRFGELGYAGAARASWQVFSALRDDGTLPESWRFQVNLPTPLAPMFFIDAEQRLETEPAYEAAMRQEVEEISTFVPQESLAFQWDVAMEFGILEGVFPAYFPDPEGEILQRLVRYGNWIPEKAELGYHLCYGDQAHRHFAEPADAGRLVNVANGVASSLTHDLDWIHLPVPRDRNDDRYFAPLHELALHPDTELYLGLVHYTDGIEGTRRRIKAAQRVLPDFGVGTECGMGRRPPETVPHLLNIHAEVADPAP